MLDIVGIQRFLQSIYENINFHIEREPSSTLYVIEGVLEFSYRERVRDPFKPKEKVM